MKKQNDDRKFTFEMIANILKDYDNMKRKVLQLQFELRRFAPILNDEDMIDSMTFNSQLKERVAGGQASDKTANIAISYKDKAHEIDLKYRE